MLLKTTLISALIVGSGAAFAADTRFVTDQCEVPLRSGETSTHRILQALPSGTPVTVVTRNKTTGYSFVRTDQGKEGYVLSYQLLSDAIARERLTRAEARVTELEAAPDQLSGKLASLSKEHDELVKKHQTLTNDKKDLEVELAALKQTSANAVQIAEERSELRKQIANMTRELEEKKAEILESRTNSNLHWFLVGAGVLFGGFVLGLVLPNLRLRRRKDGWGTL